MINILLKKKITEAFDLLLNKFLKFKNKEKDKIKKTILKYFEVLGNEHEQTKIYRKKLSTLLFA